MRKVWALIGSAIFFVIAPGTFTVLLPWSYTRFEPAPPFFGIVELRYAGVALAGAGLVPLIESFVRFALKGLGTPAPVAPPSRLVVTGFYRHTRNPMYVGLTAIVLGEALLLGSRALLWEAAVMAAGFHLFVLAYEEPVLGSLFGAQYQSYRAHVPRWLPRLFPWTPEA